MTSRFVRLDGLRWIVAGHYDGVLADDPLGEYFMGGGMDRLKSMRAAVISEFKPNSAYIYSSKST